MTVGKQYCSVCGKEKEQVHIKYAGIDAFIECECEKNLRLQKDKADKEIHFRALMIYLDLLALAFIVVYIIDETGIVNSLKTFIKRWLNVKSDITLKPLDCSLCMTHWVCLVYAFILGHLSIFVYLYILFLSCNTDNIYAMIQKVNEAISKFTN